MHLDGKSDLIWNSGGRWVKIIFNFGGWGSPQEIEFLGKGGQLPYILFLGVRV